MTELEPKPKKKTAKSTKTAVKVPARTPAQKKADMAAIAAVARKYIGNLPVTSVPEYIKYFSDKGAGDNDFVLGVKGAILPILFKIRDRVELTPTEEVMLGCCFAIVKLASYADTDK
jgi:hypothetical protein